MHMGMDTSQCSHALEARLLLLVGHMLLPKAASLPRLYQGNIASYIFYALPPSPD